tara:strand:+ start:239 stop:388 length:150 start_codon:yes stop_codon:yes gene_type:complete
MKNDTMIESVTAMSEMSDQYGYGLREIREQQGWEDYIAYCKACENVTHE